METLTWGDLAVPAIGAIALVFSALIASYQATKGITANRQLDSTRQFLDLVAAAHGRPTDGRSAVGISEMVAAVHLIAEFGISMPWLQVTAIRTLTDLQWHEHPSVAGALEVALARLNKRQTWRRRVALRALQ